MEINRESGARARRAERPDELVEDVHGDRIRLPREDVDMDLEGDGAAVAEPFALGARVDGNRHDTGAWYAATVTRVHRDGTYFLKYDNNEREDKVPADRLRLRRRAEPQQFSVLDKVEVEDKDDVAGENFYSAYIEEVHDNDRYDVVYEDFRLTWNKEEADVHGDRIRPRS